MTETHAGSAAGDRGRNTSPRSFRQQTLLRHLLLALLPAIAVFVLCNAMWVAWQEQELQHGERLKRVRIMAELLARDCVLPLETYDRSLLQSNVNQMFLQEGVEAVEVLDRDQRVLAADNPTRSGQPASAFASDPGTITASAPIRSGDHELGSVRILLTPLSPGHSSVAPRRQGLLLGFFVLLAMVVPARLAARRLSAPLERMAHGAEAMGEGRAASRVSVRGNDALASLAQCLNETAERAERHLESERAARAALLLRVRDLAESASAVLAGDLSLPPAAGEGDDLAKVSQEMAGMTERLRRQVALERAAQAELERSGQALAAVHARLSVVDGTKTDFLAVVSHELRTPLTSIKAFAELMKDDMDDGGSVQVEFAQIMQREADRLTRLVNHLLDLSRMEAGRMDWRREKVSASALARQAVEATAGSARERGVALEVRGTDARKFEGDSERLTQALAHLLDNAVNASPSGATVSVILAEEPDQVHFRVEDHGSGIEDRYREAIFERFWQIRPEHQGGDERPRGSGLGLPLARAVAEAHGGRIEVESAPGQGSCFHLFLPMKSSTRVRHEEHVLATLQPATVRLLGRPVEPGRWRTMVEGLLEGGTTSEG